MAKSLGRALLLQVDISGTFTNVCALNERSFTLSNGAEEITAPDCTTPTDPVIQEFFYGVQGCAVDGTVMYNDTTAFNLLLDNARTQTKPSIKITWPDYGTFAFSAIIEEIQATGAEKGGLTAKLKLRSTGTITFTAA